MLLRPVKADFAGCPGFFSIARMWRVRWEQGVWINRVSFQQNVELLEAVERARLARVGEGAGEAALF